MLNRKNRILLKELSKTDFKIRYQGSALGYLWALLRPLLMFAILYIVFSKILRFGGDIPHYPVYLLAGTVFWNFFTECTFQGIHAIENRGDLIRKVSFPKYIVVLSATSTAVINLLINVAVIFIFALINGCTPSLTWLLVVPAIIELYALALGISLWLGAINVKLRDIGSIWEVLTQALFYAVPIIYPISMVTETSTTAAKIILIDPIAQVIQDVRYGVVTDQTVTTWGFAGVGWGLVSVLVVIAILIFGALFFKKRSKKFAEEV
ncbi:ABC transporter permease [Candidatus Saccharibacteria bacterium]|nr:ABC transporter permease [Candidatus Saccharibacteria bacterium]MBQ3467954.1 ABC transporter permease [Candidatus Saccharibacteria bacterium]